MHKRTLGEGVSCAAVLPVRRIRRPLGSGYAEKEREGGDSLNELLAHLTCQPLGQPGFPAAPGPATLQTARRR